MNHRRSEQDRFTPLFRIHETPDGYEIESELERSRRAEMSVKPHRHYVEIRCRRAIDHEMDAHGGASHKLGSFLTRVPLPKAIDVARTHATFRGGLLHIYAPKCH